MYCSGIYSEVFFEEVQLIKRTVRIINIIK